MLAHGNALVLRVSPCYSGSGWSPERHSAFRTSTLAGAATMSIPNVVRLAAVSSVVACAASAIASPLDRVLGDALRIQVQAGQHSALVAIPKSALIEGLSSSLYQWSTMGSVPFIAQDGTTLGSFAGRIEYNLSLDRIFAEFAFVSGVDTMEIRFASASIDQAASGAEQLIVKSSLLDLNSLGASATPLSPDTRIFQSKRGGTAVVDGIEAYAAPADGSEVRNESRTSSSDELMGAKQLQAGFALASGDAFEFEADALTYAVPAPGSAAVWALAGLTLARRRRAH